MTDVLEQTGPDSKASPRHDRLELPRPWRLLRTFGWSVGEAAGLPLAAYLVADALAGVDAGILAGLASVWLVVVLRKLICGKVPGLVMLSAVLLCIQTGLVLATGQVWIYLLQFPVAKLVLSLLFARSAPTECPLCSRLATEVIALRHGGVSNPGLHRFFQGATWLWAAIFAVLAIVFAVLIATEPITLFMVVSAGVTAAAIGFGIAGSVLWLRAVLRRNGLRLRFTSA
jgi:hypothetical protein